MKTYPVVGASLKPVKAEQASFNDYILNQIIQFQVEES